MKRTFQVLSGGIIALIVVFSACEKVVFLPPDIEIPDTVSYSQDIQPIWDSECVICHGGQRSPDLRPDVSYGSLTGGGYINTGDPASSVLMQKLYSTPHDSRATEAEKQLILAWITEGAENN